MLIRMYSGAASARPGAHDELFVRDDGDGAVALLDDGSTAPAPADAVDLPATLLFDGGSHGPNAGGWLFMVGLWTPADFRDEFVAWYRIEHMPILLECPLWDGCRFVETPVGGGRGGSQFYSLHQLNDRAALESEERKRSRSTPWFRRLSANDWFDGAFTRTLYRRPAP